MLLLWISLLFSPLVGSGNLCIQVPNTTNKGNVMVAVYNTEEGFPGGEIGCVKRAKVKSQEGKVKYCFESMPFGNYAIVIYHDENSNDKLETNWLGIPTERIGTSRNVKNNFGPPKFKDAMFTFNKDGQTEIIFLQ